MLFEPQWSKIHLNSFWLFRSWESFCIKKRVSTQPVSYSRGEVRVTCSLTCCSHWHFDLLLEDWHRSYLTTILFKIKPRRWHSHAQVRFRLCGDSQDSRLLQTFQLSRMSKDNKLCWLVLDERVPWRVVFHRPLIQHIIYDMKTCSCCGWSILLSFL